MQVSEEWTIGHMKAALIRAHWLGSVLWYKTVSILSGHQDLIYKADPPVILKFFFQKVPCYFTSFFQLDSHLSIQTL
jgi:hypothetical protein